MLTALVLLGSVLRSVVVCQAASREKSHNIGAERALSSGIGVEAGILVAEIPGTISKLGV